MSFRTLKKFFTYALLLVMLIVCLVQAYMINFWKNSVLTADPEYCALCQAAEYDTLHLVDLSRGELGEISRRATPPDTLQIYSCMGVPVIQQENVSEISLTRSVLPAKANISGFCIPCRRKLLSFAGQRYIIAHYDSDMAVSLYTAEHGREYDTGGFYIRIFMEKGELCIETIRRE